MKEKSQDPQCMKSTWSNI